MISIQAMVFFLNIKQANNINYTSIFFFELTSHVTASNVDFFCVLG